MSRQAPLPRPAGVPLRAPVHPGRFLERHYLKPLALTQTEAARRLGISRRRINELVMGHRAMSPDTAIRCALAFGLPTATWLALQADFDSYHAWQGLKRAMRRATAPAWAPALATVRPAPVPSPARAARALA